MTRLWNARRPRDKPVMRARPRLRRRLLESLRGGAHHLAAGAVDLEHREAALDEPVGTEAEDTVDSGETARIGQRFLGERGGARLARQDRGERGRVITQGGEARRRLIVELAIAALEFAA